MYAVNVRFYDAYNKDMLKGNEYYYLAYETLGVGETVVVDTRNGLALAQITSIPTVAPNLPAASLRTVVCRIDLTPWLIKEAGRIAARLP